MTLSAYFAAAEAHQQLAWMEGSTLQIVEDSTVSGGKVLITRSDTTRGSGVPVHSSSRVQLLSKGEGRPGGGRP